MTKYLGPYTGEVGYEIASWIPYLRYVLNDDFTDCVAISRSGNDAWYPCPVINLHDVMPLQEYMTLWRKRRQYTGEFKSRKVNDELDRLILARLGIENVAVHPSEMFNKRRDIQLKLLSKLLYPVEPVERWPGLPERYCAMRIYCNYFMARPPQLPGYVELPVVMLEPSEPPDDHSDFSPFRALSPGADMITVNYTANNSLEVITRVVKHADTFVSTFGGLSLLGYTCNVPTEALTNFEIEDPKRYLDYGLTGDFEIVLVK